MSSEADKYQGREVTVTLQAPTMEDLDAMLVSLNAYAQEFAMDEVQILKKGKDPDGGYKAIVTAHNFNPFTWFSEKVHRTGLGIAHGWGTGAQKAKIKHELGTRGELAGAYAREKALQEGRVTGAIAAGKERAATETEEAVEKERLRREHLRRIRAASAVPSTDKPVSDEELSHFILG